MATQKKDRRTGQLSAIHVLKAKLGLSEGDYRAMLGSLTGETSAGKMGDGQRQMVLDHLRALERGEANPPPRPTPSEPAGGAGRMTWERDDCPRTKKIKAMWVALARAGEVESMALSALNAWVAKQTGTSHVRWLGSDELNRAIEQLKAWHQRVGIQR